MIPLRVGILGAGQLAQMLALSAQSMGIQPLILAKKKSDCACRVTSDLFFDDGTDKPVEEFLSKVDVVTIENEFIDIKRFKRLLGDAKKEIFPRLDTLELVQSKLGQKRFLKKNKIPSSDFVEINSLGDLDEAYSHFRGRLVIKQSRLGYDGRGTFIFNGRTDQERFIEFKTQRANQNLFEYGYAEPVVDFKKELSVVITRSKKGEIAIYPTFETFQKNGICQWTIVPANISRKESRLAHSMATNVMKKLKAVGTFAIEMFSLKNGDIFVNEIAPRVHNSGHVTQNSALVSQFEQHLRAITGMNLGECTLSVSAAAMVNIIGAKELNLDESTLIGITAGVLDNKTWLHWYGKSGFVLNRKLGHVNSIGASVKEALSRAQKARKKVLI